MKIYGNQSNEIIIKEIGKRIKDRRIAISMSQKQLSKEAEVSLKMISNFENGTNISLNTLISILRVLRIIENLELLIPESKINPFDIVELGKQRRRVNNKGEDEQSNWKWGDE